MDNPKISANLETRKSQILENIDAKEKREESELKIKEFEDVDWKIENQAKSYINNAKEKLIKNINIKKDAVEKDLSVEIQKVETEIQELRNRAPERINKIAVETSADLLHQLIGVEVNNSSISAIVDDLSRKKMKKYYGN